MPLETGTYTSDLVSTNPAHTDSVGQADSHLRLIKSVLQATFAGITGAVTATHTQLNAAVAAVVAGTIQALHLPGSAGAPGVSFAGFTNTGVYLPASGQVGISAGGVPAAVFKSDQSLTVNGAYSGGTGQLGLIGEPRLWLANSLPAGNFAWLNGGTVSRTTWPVLFTLWGTSYVIGDGSTTFGLPNFQECVPVGRGTMGGAADPGYIANSGATAGIINLGVILGEGKHTLTVPELATHTPVFTGTNGAVSVTSTRGDILVTQSAAQAGGGAIGATTQTSITSTGNFTPAGTIAAIGSSTPHNIVQPSFVCNWIVLLG